MFTEAFAHEERLQGLGRRDQEVGRIERLFPPFVLRRIPVPDTGREREFPAPPLHPRKYIAVQRPERGDVDRLEPRAGGRKEPVEDRKHRALGLPRAGRGDQDQVFALEQERDGLFLCIGKSGKPALPDDLPDRGAEEFTRRRRGRAWPGSRRTYHLLRTPPRFLSLCTGRGGQARSPKAARRRYPPQTR
ncbi:MAG: hypothetical protein BWX50_00091 [Euryarchaeota archaeon ADurb.Bin009]|nr:MAG: hypothetical protein BWX50_00091 [Euryarchaeota archaeon ADurb.Bin009]